MDTVIRALVLVALVGSTAQAEVSSPAVLEDEPLYASPTRLDRVGRILAPVMINGHGPFRFVIDTGATHSAMSDDLARRLGLQTGSTPDVLLSGVTGSAVVPTVPVQQLQAGELLLRSLEMPVLGDVVANAHGILGMSGLADKRVVVDFVHDRIVISRSSKRPPNGYLSVPAKLRFGHLLVVDGRIGRVRVKAVIDTGAERTLGNRALARALGLHVEDGRALPTEVFGATPTIQYGHSMYAPTITLGDADINDALVTFGDIHVFKLWELENRPALLVGMDLLGLLDTLVIDYPRKELQIKVRSGS